ncbi:MAG: hypothetical protein HY561_09885 [Gemmatimonadetes bacterium]|nr:hypothetical protein [Gemmatimonadota bacterium]
MGRSGFFGIATFLYLWLMVGFATGTATLLGPVKWLTSALRSAGWSQHGEDLAVNGLIVLYLAVSFVLARHLLRRMRAANRRRVRIGIPLVVTAAATLSLWGWLHPALLARAAGGPGGSLTFQGGAELVFGPYPDRARLAELKRAGFTAVISLQHPAVLPFEPRGITAEREAAREVGIAFIHAPMLPWVSENAGSLRKILALARGRGRYYVHCGLGRDRANVVKRWLERNGARVAAARDFTAARSFARRVAEGRWLMERGRIVRLEPDLWLVPYPNRHELFGNMLAGQLAYVLLLLDPSDAEQREWLAEAERLFREFDVPFGHRPVAASDRAEIGRAAAAARRLPRPAAVVVARTAPREPADLAREFARAYGGTTGAHGQEAAR